MKTAQQTADSFVKSKYTGDLLFNKPNLCLTAFGHENNHSQLITLEVN